MRMRWYLMPILAMIVLLGSTACSPSDNETVPSVSTSTILTADQAPNAGQATYATVDVRAAYEQLSVSVDAQVVDVREPAEWTSTGVLRHALLIPLSEVERRAPAELAKARPVYVICNSGNRSRVASDTLIRLGFTRVYNIAGGIQAWLRAGLPVETYSR
jgi:rhodanese-related sulfurtransferase